MPSLCECRINWNSFKIWNVFCINRIFCYHKIPFSEFTVHLFYDHGVLKFHLQEDTRQKRTQRCLWAVLDCIKPPLDWRQASKPQNSARKDTTETEGWVPCPSINTGVGKPKKLKQPGKHARHPNKPPKRQTMNLKREVRDFFLNHACINGFCIDSALSPGSYICNVGTSVIPVWFPHYISPVWVHTALCEPLRQSIQS